MLFHIIANAIKFNKENGGFIQIELEHINNKTQLGGSIF